MKDLAKKVVKKLIKKKFTISLAESCTGGLLSSNITSVSGSSKIFNFGIISYSNKSKIRLLKVPKKIIKKYGSVSKEVCLSMLKNINIIGKTNLSVAITGIAGPRGGTKKKPIGLVFIGIKCGNRFTINKYIFRNKGRSYIQKAAVYKSFKLILSLFK